MTINVLSLIIFIGFSAFFSASETAIFSLSTTRLRRMQNRYPGARRVKFLLKKPAYLLCTIVFGNMLVNIGLSSLTTAIFVSIFKEKGALAAIVFSGVVILFLGEIFPKTFAIYLSERISLLAAPLLEFFSKVFYPLLISLQRLSDGVASLFTRKKIKTVAYTEEELKTALMLGRHEGQITAAEESLISYILKFKDTSASQIMTPRVDIRGLDIDSTQEEILRQLRENPHSKFPVYKESLDNISGILDSKDVFLHPTTDFKKFIRQPLFFPESTKIDDILKAFIEKKRRLAIILDEYGGTAGLVTFEDIVEEIFGEIYDEYELPQMPIKKLQAKTYRVSGKTPVKNVNIEVGLSLSEEEDTIAGFLLSKLERIPETGEKFIFNEVEFIIERASRKRLVSIIVKIK